MMQNETSVTSTCQWVTMRSGAIQDPLIFHRIQQRFRLANGETRDPGRFWGSESDYICRFLRKFGQYTLQSSNVCLTQVLLDRLEMC